MPEEILPKLPQHNEGEETSTSPTPVDEEAAILKEAVTHGARSRDILQIASQHERGNVQVQTANPPGVADDAKGDPFTKDTPFVNVDEPQKALGEVEQEEPLDADALEAAKNDLWTNIINLPNSELQRPEIVEVVQRNARAIAQMIGGAENDTVYQLLFALPQSRDSEAGRIVSSIVALNLGRLKESFLYTPASPTEFNHIAHSAEKVIEMFRKQGTVGQQHLVDAFLLENLEHVLPKVMEIPPGTTRSILLHGTDDEKAYFRSQIVALINDADSADVRKGMNIACSIFGRAGEDYNLLGRNEAYDLQEEVKEFFRHKLATYGLDADDLFAAWRQSRKPEEVVNMAVAFNIEKILTLEAWRSGICAELSNNMFKIRDFARYPDEILIDQYDNRNNTDLRYGAAFYPIRDWNGAFYEDKDPLEMLYRNLQQINESLPDGEPKYGIRIFEVGSKLELSRALLLADRTYGQQHKMEFAIIGGHGTKDSIQFGAYDISAPSNVLLQSDLRGGQRGRIEQRTRRGERIRGRVPKFFEPDPTVILVACSTGSLGGIGQEISSIGATVIAPEIPTNLKGVNVTRSSETGKLEFAVEYRDSGTERTYIAGQ